MVDWVVNNTDNSVVPVKINKDIIAVAGHSRGAKLAVLIAEGMVNIRIEDCTNV